MDTKKAVWVNAQLDNIRIQPENGSEPIEAQEAIYTYVRELGIIETAQDVKTTIYA